MSAIGGIYNRYGVIDQKALRRLGGGMRQIGPDGEQYESSTSVGMVHCPFHTDRNSRLGSQPLIDADGLMLTWDGRLDNREDLRAALSTDLRPTSDAEIVLAAFHRWGIAALARLIGDFAMALWNPHEKRLYLAVDALGLRALYFYSDEERVLWASRARSLLSAGALPIVIDDEYVAAFMTNSISKHSPYKGVRQIPGGHVMTIDRDQATLDRYWAFDPEREIKYSKDDEYEEHFRELFFEAIKCRMCTDGPVFAELSGGVDSSSIVCGVDHLRAEGRSSIPELHTVSYVFDAATSADERSYIQEIEKQRGVNGIHLLEEDYPILGKRPPADFAPDLPTNQIGYLARYDHVSQLMTECGARVLLSGIGGDQAFIAEPPDLPIELADHLVRRRLSEVLRSCHSWSRAFRTPYLKTLWQGVVSPFIPRVWQARRKHAVRVGEWLNNDFVRRNDLFRQSLGPGDDLGFRLPSRAMQSSWLRQTMRPFALTKCLSRGHMEVRYPYLDRRLLEFALAIPFEQKFRPLESRSIVRRALRGIVPSSVLERRTKAGPTEAYQRALVRERRWIGEIFSDPLAARLDYIDEPIFQSTLSRARHGLISHPAQMHRTISLELWLRTLEPGRSGLDSGSRDYRQPPPIRRQTRGVNHGELRSA